MLWKRRSTNEAKIRFTAYQKTHANKMAQGDEIHLQSRQEMKVFVAAPTYAHERPFCFLRLTKEQMPAKQQVAYIPGSMEPVVLTVC